MSIGMGAWRWAQFYGRKMKRLEDHYEEVLRLVREAGAESFEPFLPDSDTDRESLAAGLEQNGLTMPSTYRNVRLHEHGVEAAFDELVSSARWAKDRLGTTILTVNAEPVAWGKPLDKTDAQLRLQAKALRALCGTLAAEGITVAYHAHDAEFRQGAREFHAMLTQTPVSLCFDPHWVFRGCGNSQVAVETVLALYGSRLSALHLRQSDKGVFTESFHATGDLGYTEIAAFVRAHCPELPIYVEQGWEAGTPELLPRVEVDRRSLTAARALYRE